MSVALVKRSSVDGACQLCTCFTARMGLPLDGYSLLTVCVTVLRSPLGSCVPCAVLIFISLRSRVSVFIFRCCPLCDSLVFGSLFSCDCFCRWSSLFYFVLWLLICWTCQCGVSFRLI